MKAKLFLVMIFAMCIFLLDSCRFMTAKDMENMHTKYSVLIFKFKDNSNMNNVIARDLNLALSAIDDSIGIVHCLDFFRDCSNKDTYFFEYDSIHKYGTYNPWNKNGYKYYNYYGKLDSTNICDFAKAPKYVELHDGYYMWYPYVYDNNFDISEIKFYNITWDELCNNDSLYYNCSLPMYNIEGNEDINNKCLLSDAILPIGDIYDVFERACEINGIALERHSHKKINKMTIQDVIDVCNIAIDNIDELTCGYNARNYNFVIIR